MKWGCTPPPFQMTGKMRLLTNEWFIQPLSQWCKKLNASQDEQKMFAYRHHSVFLQKSKFMTSNLSSSKLPDDLSTKNHEEFSSTRLAASKNQGAFDLQVPSLRFETLSWAWIPWCLEDSSDGGRMLENPPLFWTPYPDARPSWVFGIFTYVKTHKTSTK